MDLLRRVGLARLLRLFIAMVIPPLWFEIAVLHYRGSFQSRLMWLPVLGLPATFVGGLASGLAGDGERARALFRPLAWLMAAMGLAGTVFHVRGVGRQMAGFRNWKYNVVTGPPLPAPPQVALFGLIGALAAAPPSTDESSRLVAAARAVNVLSYPLLAVESGYEHWKGGLFNKVMFTPLVLSPLLTVVHLGALLRLPAARAIEGPLSAVATLAGLVGFGFHLRNQRGRTGGWSWQNLFYGAPVVAPLQLTGQGMLGLLAAAFGGRR